MTVEVEVALNLILEKVEPVGAESVVLAAAWERVLGEDLCAASDFPPFDRSPLDGYAVVAADVAEATPEGPVRLKELEVVGAGAMPCHEVISGTATRIMTGAPIPLGATGVVRLEDTSCPGAKEVLFFGGKGCELNICRQGEEFRQGEMAVKAGAVIRSGVMGLLAMFGRGEVRVFRRPRVLLLATGDEIIDENAVAAPGKIRNSNSPMLAARVLEAGGSSEWAGCIADDAAAICSRLEMSPAEVVITTGGVSVGDYDVMPEVFSRLGIEPVVQRVSMKPGMPVLAGWRHGQLIIALSGNPAAAAVAFERLVRPALLQLGGRSIIHRRRGRGRLRQDITKTAAVLRHVWATVDWGEAGYIEVDLLPRQGNGMLRAVAMADVLLFVPPGQKFRAGDWIDFIFLDRD